MAPNEEIWVLQKVHNLHTGMIFNIRTGGEVSFTFAITNGVKQWCVLASMLFSIFLLAMLEGGFQIHGGRSLRLITPECRPLYSCTLQSEDKKHKYTCEKTPFSRRERTGCPLSRGDLEDC